REKPSPSKSDMQHLTSSSDSGNQSKKKKQAGQQPESDTRRRKLNQLKEQYANLKSVRRKSSEVPTDEEKTVPVVRSEMKRMEEKTAIDKESKIEIETKTEVEHTATAHGPTKTPVE
ncbi:hypothetical protein PFISCL1PPCAC_16077, partial [Pristionchus fissidentatus]